MRRVKIAQCFWPTAWVHLSWTLHQDILPSIPQQPTGGYTLMSCDLMLNHVTVMWSIQFYGLHLTKPKVAEVELGDRKGDRWRQKSKQLKFFFMRSEERTRNEAAAGGRESPSVGEATPYTRQPTRYKVQIIDVNTQTDGIRPYSLYVLLVRSEGGKQNSQCPLWNIPTVR